MIDLWGEESGPYLQALHFIIMIGATVCPQLAKLFISIGSSIRSNSNSSSVSNVTGITFLELKTVQPTNTSSSHSEVTLAEFETKVHDIYMFISLFAVLAAILHLAILSYSKCNLSHINTNSRTESLDANCKKGNFRNSMHQGNRFRSIIGLAFLCLIVAFFGGLEEIFGAFLISFSINQLEWTASTGRDLVSVFWGSAATARFISIFLACCVKPRVLLGTCTIFSAVITIIMTFTVNLTHISIWLGTVFVGLSIGSLVATVISMGKSFLNFSGFLSSVVFVSMFVGKIATPPLMGYLLQENGYMWFMYISAIYASFMFVNYCMLLFLSMSKLPSQQQNQPETKDAEIKGRNWYHSAFFPFFHIEKAQLGHFCILSKKQQGTEF